MLAAGALIHSLFTEANCTTTDLMCSRALVVSVEGNTFEEPLSYMNRYFPNKELMLGLNRCLVSLPTEL